MLGSGIGIAITITIMASHAQNSQLRYEQQWERFDKMIEKRIVQLKRSAEKASTQHDLDSLKARIDKLEDAQIYLDHRCSTVKSDMHWQE